MAVNQLFLYYPSAYDYYCSLPPPAIHSDPYLLLIEEVIDYSLRHHNIRSWVPPVDLQFLRFSSSVNCFNKNFGNIVINYEVERAAISLARRNGFSKETWRNFEDHETSRIYLFFHLRKVYLPDEPMLHKMFSFACYASRLAIEWNRISLVNDVVWALLSIFREIVPYETYHRACNAVTYKNNDPGVDPENIDEGLEEEINDDLSFVESDSLILLVEELINYSLHFSNLREWIPSMNIQFLRIMTKQQYFNESLGRAVTHHFTEQVAVQSALAGGFDEKKWLELCNYSEARVFLFKAFRSTCSDVFLMLSFACYASKIAMRNNRNGLVNAVVWALVRWFSSTFPFQNFYRQLASVAATYTRCLPQGEDEGIDE